MQILCPGNGHMPVSPVNQQRSDLSSISSYNYDGFVSGQSSVASERPKSDKFLQFIDKKKRMKSDPDGVSSSLSDRTKLHLSRAKKLVNSGRSVSDEESTVRVSYTTTDSMTNNSSESRSKSMSLLERKKSLVKRFEEREDNQIFEPIIPPVEKENINQTEPSARTRNTDDNADDETEVEDTRSICWDAKTVMREQSRIRGILESRLGSGYINRPRDPNSNKEVGPTIFFLPKTEPQEVAESTEIELKDYATKEISEDQTEDQEETLEEETLDEETLNEETLDEETLEEETRASISEETEDEYSTLGDSLHEEDQSTLSPSIKTLDKKVCEEATKQIQLTSVALVEKSSDTKSKASEESIDTVRLKKAASRLRPVFKELRILSTRSESKRMWSEQIIHDSPSEIVVKVDPPSVCNSGEKCVSTGSLSVSTYGIGSKDKYAAPSDEKSFSICNNVSEEKMEASIEEVKPSDALNMDNVDEKLPTPKHANLKKNSGNASIRTWNNNVSVDDHYNVADSQCTDLDSIADMVLGDKNNKKKRHASSRSFSQINKEETLSISDDSCEIEISNSGDEISCMSKSTCVSSDASKPAQGSRSIVHGLSSKTSVNSEAKMYKRSSILHPMNSTRSQSVPRGRSSKVSISSEVKTKKSLQTSDSKHTTRSQSVPRGRSSITNVNSEVRIQKSPSGVSYSRRSMSPARSRSSYNSTRSSHMFRREDSFESIRKEPESKKQMTQTKTVPLMEPNASSSRISLSTPPRPKTTASNARDWFKKNGHENYGHEVTDQEDEGHFSEPSVSFESAGLNTLESETLDKSLSNPIESPSFEECRDPPEGNDPPGKLRVEAKKTRLPFFRNVSRHLSRQMSRPSSRSSKQPTIMEDEQDDFDKSISPRSSRYDKKSNDDDLESLRLKPLKVEPLEPVVDPVVVTREKQVSNYQIHSHPSEDIIESSRSVEQRDPVGCEVLGIQVERQLEKRASPKRLDNMKPPTTIFETENSMDSSLVSSTIETLEAENRDLKRQLASMMELLEETDASVAYLQEALKKGQPAKLQLGPSQSRRSFRSSRRSSVRHARE